MRNDRFQLKKAVLLERKKYLIDLNNPEYRNNDM